MAHIMWFLVCVTAAVITAAVCVTLCDEPICACKYTSGDNADFLKLDVDCSYNEGLLNSSLVLPSSIYGLDLSSNQLTHINQSSLLTSNTMEVLYLNKNSIYRIDVKAFRLPNLRYLDLSDNSLDFLEADVFVKTRKLEYLNLASNKFAKFAPMAFRHLYLLRELVLDNNDIGTSLREVNPFHTNGLTSSIKNMSLRNIKLNFVPDNFLFDAYDLRRLTISANNLTIIPELPFTLEFLDISDNPIPQLYTEDFLELVTLKELRLNNLSIKEIPEYIFAPLKALLKLELERNTNLTDFSSLAFGNEVLDDPDYFQLETLSLKGSRLTTLSEDLLVPFGELLRLDLQGNPWVCDCKLVWLKQLQISSDDNEYLRCASPKSFYNSKIFDLQSKYFKCPLDTSHQHYLALLVAAASLCVLLSWTALWLFFCLPRYQTPEMMREIYSPTTVYAMLPMRSGDKYKTPLCASPKSFYNSKIFDLQAKYFKCPLDTSHQHYLALLVAAASLCVLLSWTALWLFFCLPRYQTPEMMREIYSPTTVYAMLPMRSGDK